MREKYIELKLVKAVKKMGGLALKLLSPSMQGLPDRLILLPSGRLGFIEVKATGEQLRPLQIQRKQQLEGLGFLVFCLDDPEKIGEILDAIQVP